MHYSLVFFLGEEIPEYIESTRIQNSQGDFLNLWLFVSLSFSVFLFQHLNM